MTALAAAYQNARHTKAQKRAIVPKSKPSYALTHDEFVKLKRETGLSSDELHDLFKTISPTEFLAQHDQAVLQDFKSAIPPDHPLHHHISSKTKWQPQGTPHKQRWATA